MTSKLRERLNSELASINPVDTSLEAPAREHLDDLTKPKGSLGKLEDIAAKLYCIGGGETPGIDPARIYTIAGDHGVAAAGVSPFPQEVTRQMVANFLNQGAGINVLANTAGIDIKVVDAGSAGEAYDAHPNLLDRKVASGTANLAEQPAMTEDQCAQAVLNGIELADDAKAEGFRAVGTGEMGIGNTTPSTALYCAYFGLAPEAMTGPGAGLPASEVSKKADIIKQALVLHADVVEKGDPFDILTCLGGFEIATLTGLILGAAKNRIPVVVDGFISTAAYAAAWKINPDVAGYAFSSHASAEPGHAIAVSEMGMKPLLHLDFRLGEGTGAAIAMFLLRSAASIYNDMATFSQAGVTAAD